MRIGIGFDIHKLVEGKKFILGGVEIPFEKGFLAHSDGDVLIHAIIDGILGALGKKDIGSHFPDNDIKYKDIDSAELLREVCRLYKFKIINIDCNVICQKPKLMPYVDSMKEKLSEILEITTDLISIKAKTNEELGEIGAGRAVSSQCVVLLEE